MIKGIGDLMKDIAPEMIATLNINYENRRTFDYDGLLKFIDSKEASLSIVKLQTPHSLIIRDEYSNAMRLIRLGAALQRYIDFRSNLSLEEEKSQLKSIRELGAIYLDENKRLWLVRNKPGGYDRSTLVLNSLMQQVNDRLLLLDKSFFSRGWSRFLEKIGTAAAVIYLKSAS